MKKNNQHTKPARRGCGLRLRCALLLALALGSGASQGPARAQFPPPGAAAASSEVVAVTAHLNGAAKAGGRADLVVALKIKPSFHINANPASESYLIATQVLVGQGAGLKAGKPSYPRPTLKHFSFFPKPLKVYQGALQIHVPVAFSSAYRGAALAGSLKYQACNDKSCLPPVTLKWKATGASASANPNAASTIGSAAASGSAEGDAVALKNRFNVKGLPTLVFLDAAGNERADLRAGEELTLSSMGRKVGALRTEKGLAQERGSAGDWGSRLSGAPLWLQLVLVFVGGLLLNLTPCVYPMIPITVGYFGTQSEGRAGKTFSLAVFYVLGLSLVYSALGVFASLTGSLFGSTMQSPYVLGFVAIVLGVFGLSMLGLFTLNPPRWAMSRAGAKKGSLGALGMGALLGVVAAPCVGPVVAALLTYVGAQGNVLLGFSLFFVLSLGLGLPYLLLGMFSGSAKSLPRAGAWMEKSKKIFAVPLVLAALYYAVLAVKSVPSSSTQAAAAEQSAPAQAGEAWPRATLAALEQAKAQQRPVVLDFRADWCLPCLKMEREIFKDKATRQAALKNNVLLLQVDLTRAS